MPKIIDSEGLIRWIKKGKSRKDCVRRFGISNRTYFYYKKNLDKKAQAFKEKEKENTLKVQMELLNFCLSCKRKAVKLSFNILELKSKIKYSNNVEEQDKLKLKLYFAEAKLKFLQVFDDVFKLLIEKLKENVIG